MSLTPVRQRLLTLVSPSVADFLVAESVSTTRSNFPAYGTPHPDASKFPNHRFCFAAVQDDQGLFYTYYYAAERLQQDLSNFEFTDADIAGTKFKAVKRTYITLRDDFDETAPTMGTQMPDVPSDMYDGEYILAIREQSRIGDKELDSLFVVDVHTYIKRCTITDVSMDPTLGIGVSKTTTVHYRGDTIYGSSIEDIFDSPTSSFWGQQDDGTNVEGRQISDNWFAVIVTSSRDDALEAYQLVTPSTTDVRVPDELLGVSVVWNKGGGVGEFNSDFTGIQASEGSSIRAGLSGSEQASANASASIQPDLVLDIKERDGHDVPCLACFFFLKLVDGAISDGDFLGKLGTVSGQSVTHWPVFMPIAHSIVLSGMKVSVAARASGSASFSAQNGTDPATFTSEKNEGSGTDIDYSTMMGTTRVPPTIHNEIVIADTTDTQATSASCDVGWVGEGTATITINGTSYPLKIPDVSANASTNTINATGSVSPTTLPATVPAVIPTSGWYVTNMRTDPLDSQWMRCYGEVFNAAVFAGPA